MDRKTAIEHTAPAQCMPRIGDDEIHPRENGCAAWAIGLADDFIVAAEFAPRIKKEQRMDADAAHR
jgi:hypothetical protein